ncbi:HlyD family efflux transporter periplasmic adaptor subunit [Anaerocolumna sp.]|uniref:HlyD family efflux transporter periplasmic adaptor subunit n=1 Tax=Anaerocolumna sp. TaxID=2041569 RepID=UPI0028AF72C9|nr:HlyD family efflux transporter periplasmic adaptor subunit [Anaerocolumna sp.]
MKPILIDINELSDSREFYESKPNVFITMFIYLILLFIIVAFIWMYFGHIDIVVKSEGMIRPNDKVASISGTFGGTIESVHYEDGTYVKENELLFTIEHENVKKELEFYENQHTDAENSLKLLHIYKNSVEDGINYFTNSIDEEEYYLKFEGYYINYQMLKNEYEYGSKEMNLNLQSTSEQLLTLNNSLRLSKKLKNSIEQNKNLFTKVEGERDYLNRYLKYVSDYQTLENQYNSTKSEIDLSTAEEGLVNSYEHYERLLKGLNLLYSSIEADKNLFTSTSSYSLQYEEYDSKRNELIIAYEQAKENHSINKALEGLAVTEWEVQQSMTAMEEAERAIKEYKISYLSSIATNITDVKKNVNEIKLAKDNTQSKEELLEENEKNKKAALDNFKLQYIVELEAAILALNDNITSLQFNKDKLELQEDKNRNLQLDKDQPMNIIEYRNNELRTTINSINSLVDKKAEIEANIDKLNTQIDNAIVKATKSGIVNTAVELVEGDFLPAGTEVLTIIPDDSSEYKVNIYVSNADIGKLKEGMKIKFNIYALPNSEYGYLTGDIAKISKDIKVDSANSVGYYLVEAKLDNNTLYNSKGEKAQLKAGMSCQAQIITENKRILFYLLEKIDLWFD